MTIQVVSKYEKKKTNKQTNKQMSKREKKNLKYEIMASGFK